MSKKYNGMKRARDWVGQPIRTTRTMRNGVGEYPAGTKGIVEELSRGGLSLALYRCSNCQGKEFISRVDYHSVEIDQEIKDQGPAQREAWKSRAVTLLNSCGIQNNDGHFAILELNLPAREGRQNARQLRDLAHALNRLAEYEDALNLEPELCAEGAE